MQDALLSYFNGEKYAALVLTGLGIIALVAAAVFFPPRWGLRSFAVTLGILALIEIALGVGLYLRTGLQVSALLGQLGTDAPRLLAEEGARMARVQRNFIIVQYVEVAVIVGAAVVAMALKGRVTASGVALGLLIHAAVLLTFDMVAERRGALYVNALQIHRSAT